MKPEPEKPLRLGLMPIGLVELGILVMLGTALLVHQFVNQLFSLIAWLARWFES